MIRVRIANFKNVRIKTGFSQRGLAKASGLSGTLISQFESNDRNPSPQSAKKICDALDVDFDEIFFTQSVSNSKQLA